MDIFITYGQYEMLYVENEKHKFEVLIFNPATQNHTQNFDKTFYIILASRDKLMLHGRREPLPESFICM